MLRMTATEPDMRSDELAAAEHDLYCYYRIRTEMNFSLTVANGAREHERRLLKQLNEEAHEAPLETGSPAEAAHE